MMRKHVMAGLLGVASLALVVASCLGAELGGDCTTKAAMGIPCNGGDIDNSQLIRSQTNNNTQSGIVLRQSTQLGIPDDQHTQMNPNIIKNSQGDSLIREQMDDPNYLYMRRGQKEPPTQTPFQNMVENATGLSLPIFGQDIFDTPAMLATAQNVPVSSDYAVGPGDEILVRAWGQVDIDYHAVVDRNGIVSIPKIGSINVAGVKYDQLQGIIKTSISRIYNNFDLTVTLGQLRSFQVFVVGQVKHPGGYTISPMSTLVNAVYLAGGPSASGSLRRIQLKRGGNLVSEFDFYDLLLKGDKTRDLRLQSGDVVQVLAVGPLVAIAGSVNLPAVYEAKDGENLSHLIAWAGGLSTTAQTQKISLQRNLNGAARQVQDIELNKDGLKTDLKAGDVAIVSAISPQIKNSVTLRGNIAESKHFAWHKGLTVRDLIPDREALITKDYWLNKNITLLSDPNNREVKNFNYKDKASLNNDYNQIADEDQRKTGLKRTLSEINWDYAVVERLDRETLTNTLIPFSLGRAIIEGDTDNNLVLEPGDVITVFSKDDIAVPLEKRSVYVRLEGEFNRGGLYKVKQGETLRQLVGRVGGVTANAYLFATELKRESLRIEQQKVMDAAIQKAQAQLALNASYSAKNALSPEDAAAAKASQLTQSEYLNKLKEVKATGRLVFNLPENATLKDLPEAVLYDGDVVTIPALRSTLSVVGEVVAPNSFLYTPGAKIGDFIRLAGGANENGDKSRFYVVHPNGVTEASRGGFFSIGGLDARPVLPGDEIVIPPLAEKGIAMKNFKDITQIFYQFGLGAAAIRVLTK